MTAETVPAIDRYAVIGCPARHSLSPRLHAHFAELTGEAIEYRAIELDENKFESFWDSEAGRRLSGANITLPFKERAFRLVTGRRPRAVAAGAVNTIMRIDGQLIGDNTDGFGLVRDLEENLGWCVRDRRILVVGAGGAARGVVAALRTRGPAHIVVANRTVARAEALSALFPEVEAVPLDKPGSGFDGVINATSTGHRGEPPALPASVAAGRPWAYDLSYGKAAEPFQSWCKAHGVTRFADGMGMLVEQGAESFRLWRGVRPPTTDIIPMLRRLHSPTG